MTGACATTTLLFVILRARTTTVFAQSAPSSSANARAGSTHLAVGAGVELSHRPDATTLRASRPRKPA
jgi:hypothetical protein